MSESGVLGDRGIVLEGAPGAAALFMASFPSLSRSACHASSCPMEWRRLRMLGRLSPWLEDEEVEEALEARARRGPRVSADEGGVSEMLSEW